MTIVVNKTHEHPSRRPPTVEYAAWCSMIQRCCNPNNPSYKNYGGRGITIHEEWLDFVFFLEDMGSRPSNKHSIDRIDNNGNYEPGNCRWANSKEQNNNKRIRSNSVYLYYKGIRFTLKQWSVALNINYSSMYTKYRRGKTADVILEFV